MPDEGGRVELVTHEVLPTAGVARHQLEVPANALQVVAQRLPDAPALLDLDIRLHVAEAAWIQGEHAHSPEQLNDAHSQEGDADEVPARDPGDQLDEQEQDGYEDAQEAAHLEG